MFYTETGSHASFKVKASRASNASDSAEEQARLIWISRSNRCVVDTCEPRGQVWMPTTEHAMDLSASPRRILLDCCEKVNSFSICLLGEPTGHEIVRVHRTHRVGCKVTERKVIHVCCDKVPGTRLDRVSYHLPILGCLCVQSLSTGRSG